MERNLSLCIVLALLVPFSTLSLVNAEVTDISTDKQALLALKARISHDPSNLLANNWSTTTSVCSWTGITCAGRHHRVTALNISNLALTGTLPPQLGNLSFLAMLVIKNNSFYGSFPEELAHLHRLKYLSFGFNRLSGGLPENIFYNLPNLEFFSLPFNMLQGRLPSALSKCKKLQILSLSFNYFTGVIPKEIRILTQLKRLLLNNNKLQGMI
ncbi:hypothetical protein Pint_11697 [Pistacia integerrima]|uniref:Uncharacterized protein n=1 Tax=Pistacia integerrima TaxID=434235 RepID=A0ACC0XFC9_9ROSI|nr:hypothetical protein Pint_11697 [Pistacia integerrima]